jgi:nitroreductase
VLVTVATTGAGVPALVDKIAEHRGAVGVGTRLKPHADAPSVDDVAAVDGALAAERTTHKFLATPVSATLIGEILRVANRATAGWQSRPWRVRALAGEPLARLRGKLGAAGFVPPSEGAPACLVFTTDQALERAGWLDYGMFLQRVAVAARARGLDACSEGALAPFHKAIAGELALGRTEIVVCALALGLPDPTAVAPAGGDAAGDRPTEQFAQFSGFDPRAEGG